MKVKVLTFASIKDICGFDKKDFNISEEIVISKLLNELSEEFPDLNNMTGHMLFAKNEEYCTTDTILKDGDTLAIFPPVSGG